MSSSSIPNVIPSVGEKATSSRLLGLDLLRGLAMLAVILLHSDEWNGIEVLPGSWSVWIELSGFAVPFFLAASFYLSVSRLISRPEKTFPLRLRISRLMIPYIAWSVIYLAYKTARYGLLGKLTLLQSLASDPLLIVFFGGAGFHLYFLPLLMTGTVLLKPLSGKLLRALDGWLGLIVFIMSIALYEGLIQTGNTVDIATGTAFSGWFDASITNHFLLRPMLVYLAWTIRCLPYIALAIVLYPIMQKYSDFCRSWMVFGLLAITFISVNLYGSQWISPGLLEILRGYLSVLFAIALSYRLKPNPMIVNLGVCSFGIYLSHLLFLEVFQTAWIRLSPETAKLPSLALLFSIAGLTFLLSWGLTHLLASRRMLSRYLFGT